MFKGPVGLETRAKKKSFRSTSASIVLALICAGTMPIAGYSGAAASENTKPAANSLSSSTSEPAAQASPPATWKILLEQVEPLYVAGKYKEALPQYVKAVEASSGGDLSPSDRITCLSYLADCYCRLNEADNALAQYEKIDSLISADDTERRVNNLDLEALCYGLKLDYNKAEALCRSALKLCSQNKPEQRWLSARTQAQLAYFDYQRAKYALAIEGFQQAERELSESERTDLQAMMLGHKLAFAQAGSYYHLRRFDEAYKQFQRLYEIDVRLFGKTNLQTGWTMLALSDVLEKINQQQQADDWYRKAIYVFRKFNRDRLCVEFGSTTLPNGDVQEWITRHVFGKSAVPSGLEDAQEPLCKDSKMMMVVTHDPRSLYAPPFMDAPGRVWVNPAVKLRGIVIAVHGLSLEHSSYDAFARQLADYGFCTVAFDVRGFGTYRQALGAEKLDFDGCKHDLQLVVSAIKSDSPGVPLFILGESMGGAIALQFAAQNPQLIDGLIASVPAGKRFHGKNEALKVAVHFLGNKNRPFDIGTDVINQATHDPRVKEAWGGDPKTRSTLSPRELIAFQSMVNMNLDSAKKIRQTPVMMFQGVSDGLVKPEATYDLFRAIGSKDKSFVMVGNTEHLIFEEGCFTPAVLKGVAAWMESHPPSSIN